MSKYKIHSFEVKSTIGTVIPIKIENRLFCSQNVFGAEKKEVVEKYLSELKSLFSEDKLKIDERLEENNLKYNIKIANESDCSSFNNFVKKVKDGFVSDNLLNKDINKLRINRKICLEMDLTKFYETQDDKIIGVGAIVFGDRALVQNEKTEDGKNTYKLFAPKILFAPNPCYVNQDMIKDYYKVFKFFDNREIGGSIYLPNPMGPTGQKIVHLAEPYFRFSNIMIYILYKPYKLSDSQVTYDVIPSISNVYSATWLPVNKMNKVNIRELYRNQQLETRSIFGIYKTYANNKLDDDYLSKKERCVIDVHKTTSYLERYFYFRNYDSEIYGGLPNIMLEEPVRNTKVHEEPIKPEKKRNKPRRRPRVNNRPRRENSPENMKSTSTMEAALAKLEEDDPVVQNAISEDD